MPISGLATTLSSDHARAEAAVVAFRAEPRLDVGPRDGRHIAVTAETADAEEDRGLWRWITARPGVAHVDVVFISFEPEQEVVAP